VPGATRASRDRTESRVPEGTADNKTPNYYRGAASLQPFDVIDAFGLDFYEGSALKYLIRWKQKNGLEDLEKCAHYIECIRRRAEETLPEVRRGQAGGGIQQGPKSA